MGSEKLIERIMAKRKIDDETGCWIYQGYLNSDGYGRISQLSVHRLAFEVLGQTTIPKGMCVCHKCDTPACFNPEHLFIGTQLDNVADMKRKGRARNGLCGASGSKHPFAWIDSKMVARVLRLRERKLSVRRIADQTGVSQTSIYTILRGKNWSQLEAK